MTSQMKERLPENLRSCGGNRLSKRGTPTEKRRKKRKEEAYDA